jgi:hypothetical protein
MTIGSLIGKEAPTEVDAWIFPAFVVLARVPVTVSPRLVSHSSGIEVEMLDREILLDAVTKRDFKES